MTLKKHTRKLPFRSYGLTHIALAVKDPKRSVDFYKKVFGAEVMYLRDDFAQICTPGKKDIIVFEKKPKLSGKAGGIMHFGFRLPNPKEISKVIQSVKKEKATIVDQGEFVPGSPFIFFKDPDGYVIEVWYEKPL